MRLPVQIFYDSSVKEEGLVGLGWKIPQLESSAIPEKGGAIWTAPWGEKIFFYSRKNTSRDILNLFNEKERENAYFSPYADWTANGRADSGSWTIYGRKDMRGWKFVYVDAKLRKIEAPSGQHIDFAYADGKLVSVGQRGIAKYTDFSGKDTTTYYFMRYDVAYNGKVRQIVDGRKRVLASYRYDKDTGKITRYRDKAKNDINFKYDSRGNLVLISKRGADEDSSLPVRSFSYNKGNLKPVKVNELDETGEVVRTTSIQYDSEFRPVYIDDGRNTLKISYNFYGYPSKTVDNRNNLYIRRIQPSNFKGAQRNCCLCRIRQTRVPV